MDDTTADEVIAEEDIVTSDKDEPSMGETIPILRVDFEATNSPFIKFFKGPYFI